MVRRTKNILGIGSVVTDLTVRNTELVQPPSFNEV